MSARGTCPQCGAELRGDALEGLCPECLGKLALGSEGQRSEVRGQRSGGDAAGEVEGDGDIAPVSAIQHPVSSIQYPATRFGDYELLSEIAQGGMGVVFKARQVSLNRTVAVKMIRAGQFASKEFVHRFRVEASAAAVLQHPNIVAVHEVGVHEGQHFFSMDYVAGKNLAQIVRDGPLPPARAARYVQKIAEAIHYAHQTGILHRDLKPSNVLIDQHDQPRITDFGLAKQLNVESSATLTGDVMGTPGYMPPEQASGNRGAVKAWSDVYSMGAILYHLLTGRAPFAAGSLEETLNQVLHQDPVSLRLLNPAVPRDLNTICLKCLEKEPIKRYGSAQLLADELTRFLNHEPILARPISTVSKGWRWCRRKPALATALTLLVVVAVGSPIAAFRINQQRELAEARLYVSDMNLGYQALLDGNFARARELLDAHRHHKPDRRGFEWRYLWERTRGDFAHDLLGHSNAVRKVVWSPDGALLASHSMDRKVKIWSADGKERLTLTNISALARFSADNTRLFLGRDSNSVVAYNWKTRVEHPLLDGVGDLIAVLPDDQAVATTSTNFALRLWNTSTREMVRQLPGTGGFLLRDLLNERPAVVVSRDGKLAAVAQRGERVGVETITIWDVATQKELVTVSEHRDGGSMQFSPDNSLFAFAGGGGFVRLWETASNREPRVIRAHEATVRGVAFSHDGRVLATGSSDQTIKLWDVATGRNLATLRGHEHSMPTLDFTSDGKRLASGSWDETIKIWDLTRPAAVQMISGFEPDTIHGIRAVFSDDGRFVAVCCQTNDIRIWDTTTLREIATLPGGGDPLRGGFSRDGKTLLTFTKTSLRLFDIGSQALLKETRLEQPPRLYSGAALSADAGLLAVSDENLRIGLWQVSTGHKDTSFIHAGALATPLSFSPSGGILAAIEGRTVSSNRWVGTHRVHLWGGEPLAPLNPLVVPESTSLNAFVFSPDGRFIATRGRDRWAYLWELSTRRLVGTFKGHRQQLFGLAFSPEGRLLATGSTDGTVKLWDIPLRRELATLKFNESGSLTTVGKVAFSPNGSVLMAESYDGAAIRFFRAPTWEQIAQAEMSAGAAAETK